MKKRVNILYQCDDNFAFMTGVSFTSLVLNASEDIFYDIYLLTPDMSEENRNKYYEVLKKNDTKDIRLTFLSADECQKEVASWNVPSHRGSWVTYFKLFIARFFPEESEVDKIIHIGADTLVTGDLEELADFDFHGMPFAMNWSEKHHYNHYPRKAHNCVAEMVYFNLPEWRKHNCEQRIIQYAKAYGDVYGSKDQGILCTQFMDEYAQLPLKFNIYGMTYYFNFFNRRLFNNAPVITRGEIQDAYAHPEIIHIARTFLYRPCEENSMDRLYDMWWDYCNKSPWKGMQPLKEQPMTGAAERFFRFLFKVLPFQFAGTLYVLARHWSGNVNWVISLMDDKIHKRNIGN